MSPYFSNAHDFHVQSLNITHQEVIASKAFDHLHDNVAADAVHNSDERCSIPNCMPETRKAVQGEIHSWITDGGDDDEPKIMWLTGPAGCGKTAIAGSVAEACEDEGILAGSFFFSSFAGSDTRRTKRCLIATLVYCLLQHDGLQPLRASILSAMERDPYIFRKSLSAQLKALILKPLRDVCRQLVLPSLPKVVIIDGLDEVEAANSRQLGAREARLANEAEQVDLLSTLLQAVHNPNFPFRLLIVSHPEPVIRDFFSHKAGDVTREVFLDNKYDPDSDIALFLRVKFSEIRRRYKLPVSWPGEESMDKLKNKASGYPDPILSTRWIGAIWYLYEAPAIFFRQFLQDYHGQADYLLENLASLISIPDIEDTDSDFFFYHKSLPEFLRDVQRCDNALYEAFFYGRTILLGSRTAQVLSAKSAPIPLTDSQWPDFLKRFLLSGSLLASSLFNGSDEMYCTWEAHLASCDIAWWVRSVCEACPGHDPNRRRLGNFVETMFCLPHAWCWNLHGRDFDDCKPLCKRWRTDITSQRKASGWRVPNAIALLRERLHFEARMIGDLKFIFTPSFGPPNMSARTPLGTLPNLPGDDYESMFRLADLIYSRLPEGCAELYLGELRTGKTPWNALQLEIRVVMDELGVSIEDFDDMCRKTLTTVSAALHGFERRLAVLRFER